MGEIGMKRWKRGILLFSCSVILGLAALFLPVSIPGSGDVSAQEQAGITMTARVGLDGQCKKNAWIPVRVTVENLGPEVSGRVEVSYTNSEGEVSYGQDILLPTTSRREFFLYFYPQGSIRSLTANLVAKGKALASVKLTANCLNSDGMIFGVLTEDPAPYEILGEVKPLRGALRIAQLTISDLPDRAQGWKAMDALIVSGVDTSAIAGPQRQALDSWLASGGRLLVVGGPGWQTANAGLSDLLPVELVSTQTAVKLAPLFDYFQTNRPLPGATTISVGKPRPDAAILAQQEGIPLLAERRVGFGKVIYLAADPALYPLRAWEDAAVMYDRLLGMRPPRPTWAGAKWDTSSADSAAVTIDALSIPSAFYLCGWLALYVIVVGPVNFFILHRLKRRELAWLTIPALVLLFAGINYYYGYFQRGQRPILNRMAVVQAWEGVPTAEARGLVGLFSPLRTKYTLQADDEFMLFPFDTSAGNIQGGDQWLSLQEGSTMLMPDVRVEIGGVESLATAGYLPALDIQSDLVVEWNGARGPYATGQITNASPYTLRQAILVTPGDWKRLGDIPAGSSREVAVAISTTSSYGPSFYTFDSEEILNVDYADLQEDYDAFRRNEFLNAIWEPDYGYTDSNWGVYLMGWLDAPMLPIGLQKKQFDVEDTTLYIVLLDPNFKTPPGQVRLTPSLFAWDTSLESATPYSNPDIPAAGYTLRFRVGFPIKYSSVEEMTLNLNVGSGASITDVSVYIFDITSGEFVRLKGLRRGNNNIPDPWRYVGPGGDILIKIDTATNNYVEINPSTITLVVNP
jgi:hypothetical protein